ncbi:MAG: addiction module protein [Planctomycetia bacterium]|nr:addiction module protein [Planctomycetia bacterium]
MNAKAIAAEVASWPVGERLRLIEEIEEGISALDEATVLDGAVKRDLERRLEEYRDAPLAGSPWEEVEARLRGLAS